MKTVIYLFIHSFISLLANSSGCSSRADNFRLFLLHRAVYHTPLCGSEIVSLDYYWATATQLSCKSLYFAARDLLDDAEVTTFCQFIPQG